MTTGIFIVFIVVLVFLFLAALPRINSWWSKRNLARPQELAEPPAESPLPEGKRVAVPLEELIDEEPQASEGVFGQEVEDSVSKTSFGSRLAKAKSAMSGYVTSIRNSEVNESIWEQLEEALILADVGMAATSSVLDRLKKTAKDQKITKGPDLLEALKVIWMLIELLNLTLKVYLFGFLWALMGSVRLPLSENLANR